MKKTLASIAVLTAITSNAAYSAEVFKDEKSELNLSGRAQAMYYVSDDKTVDGDASYLRLSLDGTSEIKDGLYAFGNYELQLESNKHDEATYTINGQTVKDTRDDDDLDVRKAYAGIGSDLGTIAYGRQYGAVTLVSDFTDIFPEFGNEAAGVNADRFGTGRSDSVLKATTSYAGLDVHLSYQAENDEVDTDASSFGAAATYSLPYGFKVALGYNEGDGADSGDDAELLTTAISFNYEDLYIAALYSDGENWEKDGTDKDTDYEGIEAVATYKLTDDFLAMVGYNSLEKETETATASTDTVDYYSVGFEYNMNENFKALAEYKINDADNESKADNEDILALAVRYTF